MKTSWSLQNRSLVISRVNKPNKRNEAKSM